MRVWEKVAAKCRIETYAHFLYSRFPDVIKSTKCMRDFPDEDSAPVAAKDRFMSMTQKSSKREYDDVGNI